MAYCRQCGRQIADDCTFCPDCGARQRELVYVNQVYDSGSIGWFILGFFFPLIGFILWLAWLSTKPKCSKMAGLGALTPFLIAAGFVIGAAIVGALSN
ncbi:MAG: zinc ribbon domain-containing protein [Candidatus Methanomethylophilaceae archaeon]|nr:zinc ribbon domain-containing protein [Candidatus Methanomethylophilaceae archaeon]